MRDRTGTAPACDRILEALSDENAAPAHGVRLPGHGIPTDPI